MIVSYVTHFNHYTLLRASLMELQGFYEGSFNAVLKSNSSRAPSLPEGFGIKPTQEDTKCPPPLPLSSFIAYSRRSLESVVSAIVVDGLTGDAVITDIQYRRKGRFAIMYLAKEIRRYVLSFLQPDVESIYQETRVACRKTLVVPSPIPRSPHTVMMTVPPAR